MKKITSVILFSALVMLGFYSSSTYAEESSINNTWRVCAERVVNLNTLAIEKNPMKFQADFCNYIEAKMGDECVQAIEVLAELNFLQDKVSEFILITIITPKCGLYRK